MQIPPWVPISNTVQIVEQIGTPNQTSELARFASPWVPETRHGVQVLRGPPFYSKQGFVAQLEEQPPSKRTDAGASPAGPTNFLNKAPVFYVVGNQAFNLANRVQVPAGVPFLVSGPKLNR